MRRRELIALLGGAASATALHPFGARAQATLPVIGFLHSESAEGSKRRLAAFLKGLNDGGFVDGQNASIAYRWAEGHSDRLPAMAADLVARQVAVIATPGSTAASLAAKKATATIPIVFTAGTDPVALGLVASLNRPGGNATGVTSVNADVSAKRLGVIRALVPQASHYFTLINPVSPLAEPFLKDIQSGAAGFGIHLDVLRASTTAEIEAGFAGLPQQAGTALIFSPDAFFYSRRADIAALALRYAVPTIFDVRDYVDAGGLASYGTDYLDVMQTAGTYTARVLKGEKPADLPVVQSAKFETVLNLKTAKALGLTVPANLLALADDVIE